MIKYVQSVASQQVPPPYHFPGVTVNAFIWNADMAPIQEYCDDYLNLGDKDQRSFVYRPASIWPYAALLIIDYPMMVSSDRERKDIHATPFPDRGYMSQKEAFVVIPLLRSGSQLETALLNMAVQWALPFIVVENPMSAICGREMLGIPKLLGKIEFGEGKYPDSFKARVGIPGWPSLTPGKMQMQSEDLTFLEVETDPALPTFRGLPDEDSLWSLLRSDTAGKTIGALGTVNDFLENVSLGLFSTAMRTVSLRQVRDATDPSKAVYQALVSCRSTYSSIRHFQFYNESGVKIRFHNRGSFSEILKIFLGPNSLDEPSKLSDRVVNVKPKAAFRFKANIDFDHTRTLHTFPVDQGDGLPPSKETDDMLAPWFRPIRGFFSAGRP